jgi:ABC-2 type transport system ATP-binding protein
MQASAALTCDHVSHRYARRVALDDVSLTIPRGAFAALVGRNGAGKTTLISLITRLYHAQRGAICVMGYDLRKKPLGALATMGIVFQQLTIDLDLTVGENLRYHAALHGLTSGEARLRIGEELERLAVAERINERVRNLSGGMRRRAEIARALLHRPRLLLLDEPTAGLDIEARHSILTHVRALCADRGTTVLWTTHLMEEVQSADIAICLDQGRLADRTLAAMLSAESDAAEVFRATPRSLAQL